LQDKLTDDKIDNMIDVLSDTMFNYAIDETVRLRCDPRFFEIRLAIFT
jgi:hypothetical protein